MAGLNRVREQGKKLDRPTIARKTEEASIRTSLLVANANEVAGGSTSGDDRLDDRRADRWRTRFIQLADCPRDYASTAFDNANILKYRTYIEVSWCSLKTSRTHATLAAQAP
jgi:hypothetical protein